ncbi:MAG TPA: choice-of-anchor D domain-containing protein [Bryobacteraceae bacterium]|nr:choice-of-anchor D domain-containing protein [Bryobacteraceae bacterium]
MKALLMRVLLLAWCVLPALHAQFSLLVVHGASEQPVPAVYDLGSVFPGDTASVQFRLRNTSGAAAILDDLGVAGSGFALAGGPVLPVTVNPGGAVEFTVSFHSAEPGTYSATLHSVGVSALLTAEVPASLTFEVSTALGLQVLSTTTAVDFGPVTQGSSAERHFVVANQTTEDLIVPLISISAGDFSMAGPSPSGTLLHPTQNAGFDVQFNPSAVGARGASLVIGTRAFPLNGTGVAPPLPQPHVAIALEQAQSAQQGTVSVQFDSPSAASGTGTLTLAFQPSTAGAPDPAIAFAAGGRTVSFTFNKGDTQAHFSNGVTAAFQTGTTAGTLTFTAQLGDGSDSQTVTVQPAAVTVSSLQAARSTGSIEVRVTAFDNTRTAGGLTFTFYDAAGNAIAPGAIHVDGTAAFSQYFQTSNTGGTFLLRAVFPVTGDAAGIASVTVGLANSAGTTTTPRASF